MVSFRISLAGVPIQVHALFATTLQFSRAYLTEEAPSEEITIGPEKLEAERRKAERRAEAEGQGEMSCPDEVLERLALCRCVAGKLLSRGVLLFHGSALALRGKAYLFTAKSGVGKTTHSRLWVKNIPGAYVLNGDKPFLLFRDEGVFVCGTPWQGKEDYGTNEILPLEAICLLERSEENRMESLSFDAALPALSTQAYCPAVGAERMEFLRLLGRLSAVRLYRLQCNMEDDAALLAYRTLTENDHE